jgi:hypothetical protein
MPMPSSVLRFYEQSITPEPSRSSSDTQAPADAGKSQAAVPEASKQVDWVTGRKGNDTSGGCFAGSESV